jgi:2-polyprenyl-6-methoxyphenol hydroxylase-like FAD-dependent oxidoreductase
MLAASVLAQYVDVVTVIERDRLPDGPQARTGVPQARHTHLLMSGGARAIEELLPGTVDRLLQAGAHRIGLPSDLVSMTAQGWLRRFPAAQFMIACSRDLLDWVIRAEVLRDERIVVEQDAVVDAVIGDAGRVTGVMVREPTTGTARELDAEFVVDATGRGSRAPHWLAEFGLPAVREEVVDPGLAYATRVYQAPKGAAAGFPVVSVLADPASGLPGCGVTLLPIEEGRWMVTLGGTRGGEPPTDEDGFAAFARDVVRDPIVADLIATAVPLGPVHGSRGAANRRRYFEELNRWPAGLFVVGDAVAVMNPVYGHGMSVTAQGVLALRTGLARGGADPVAAHRIQRAITRVFDDAWMMATGQDVMFPEVRGPRPTRLALLQQRYVGRVMRTAASQPLVAAALFDALTLSGPFTKLATPKVVMATLRGPRQLPLSGPPLTEQERARVAGPSS